MAWNDAYRNVSTPTAQRFTTGANFSSWAIAGRTLSEINGQWYQQIVNSTTEILLVDTSTPMQTCVDIILRSNVENVKVDLLRTFRDSKITMPRTSYCLDAAIIALNTDIEDKYGTVQAYVDAHDIAVTEAYAVYSTGLGFPLTS
jgi:hypothetical protein